MQSLKLSNNYDLEIGDNGALVVVDNEQQLAQKITQRLKLFYAEWFLDTTRGVQYFQNIFGGNANIDIASQIFTDEIKKEQDVTNVINIETNFNNRKLTYSCDIISTFGEQRITFEGT